MRAFNLLPRVLRHRIIRSRMAFKPSETEDVRVKMVESPTEALAAARTVHDSYVGRGIMERHPTGIRVTPHIVLPTSHMFVAKARGDVVGTISLVLDSTLGLPMDRVYRDELAPFRKAGVRLAEVGALAVRRDLRGLGLAFLLNRIMFQCAARLRVERLVIAVHPDAEDLYAATMLFARFGQERAFPGLNKSALAVALQLDLITAKERLERAFAQYGKTEANTHDLYFVRQCPQIELDEGCFLDPERSARRLDASAALIRARMDIFRGLSSRRLTLMRQMFPNVLWPAHVGAAQARAATRPSFYSIPEHA